ncbi:MAG: amidohydrolase family protein, partial [Acidobacteriota bacterium]|nr:amidohydrolase family protein [Acidobacteriota bacterium]
MMRHYTSVVFGLVILSVASASWGQDASDRWRVVHAGTLLSSPGTLPLEHQTLVIKNDRVDRIVSGFATPESLDLSDAETINLQDHFVLPGLVDMHVHLTSDRSVSLPGVDAGRDVYSMTIGIRNARKTLHAGYTTVRNPGSAGWSIFALRDGIQSGDLEGPRLFVAGHT